MIKSRSKEAEHKNPDTNEEDENKDEGLDDKDKTQQYPEKRGLGSPKPIKTGQKGRPKKQYVIAKTTAMAGSNAAYWRKAMDAEFEALAKNKAWTLVERPKDRNVIGCRWVLRTKFKADGTIEEQKARLVAKGYSQQICVMMRMCSLRLIEP